MGAWTLDKNSIRKYSIWARTELLSKITNKLSRLGLNEFSDYKFLTILNNNELSDIEQKRLKSLFFKIKSIGYKQLIEDTAVIWFCRFAAIRFMEVNGYLYDDDLPTKRENLLTLCRNKLKDKLVSLCNKLNSILPKMFKKSDDYTFIFLTEDLFDEGSIIYRLVMDIPEKDWDKNVQIIGWLYQFYNSEQKDKVFEDLKKNIKISKENIPFATQLFTPDWVVKYMVENSLYRFWLEGHHENKIKDNWEYYLGEAEQEPEVKKELNIIRNELREINPEKIRCIDPCMGSGNIICYLFDVFYLIYKETGYTDKEAVKKIIENNIWGLDIDEKVSILADFSIVMKAREYDETFFSDSIRPKVYAINESNSLPKEIIDYFCNSNYLKNEIKKIIELMRNAKIYGSLIKISDIYFGAIFKRIDEIKKDNNNNNIEIINQLISIVEVAEMLSQKYEIVITNPPYMGGGGMNKELASFMKENYPNTKTDLFSAFLERGLELAAPNGYSCMVTMQNWMFIPSFEKFRKVIINNHTITSLLHMGNMVMGIAFGTSVSVLRKNKIHNYRGIYNHITQSDIIDEKPFEFPVNKNRLVKMSSEIFNVIPGAPVAYWASKELLEAYKNGIIGDKYEACVGIQTGDNNRFLKYWFEVPLNEIDFNKNDNLNFKKRWYPHPKGGAFRKWYGNYDYVVNWQNNGEEIHEFNKSRISIDKYNRNGISWSHTTNGAFSARIFYNSTIPNIENPVLFCDGKEQKYLLALLNSKVADYLLNMINSTMHYHVGDILHLPFINVKNTSKIENISEENIKLVKSDWDSYEYSWNFAHHPFCKTNKKLLSDCYLIWEKEKNLGRKKLIRNEEYLNKVFIELYGLQRELSSKVEEKYISIKKADRKKEIINFLSYAVGCMFGRYSLDKDGLVCTDKELKRENYISYIPEKNNIITICKDKFLKNDIITKLEEFLAIVYGKDSLEDNLTFIAESLGGKGESRQIIRNYFLKNFFVDHCKTYQKRPIYWLFDSGDKNAFKCLIYIHRYQPELLTDISNSFIIPVQSEYFRIIKDFKKLKDKVKGEDKTKYIKLIKHLEEQIEELQIYHKKINCLAKSNINLSLNDGIKHNYAILQSVLTHIK